MDNQIKSKLLRLTGLPLIALVLSAVLIFLAVQIDGNKYNISLAIDEDLTEVVTKASTVEEFLESEKIELERGSHINPSPGSLLYDDMELVISNPKTYTIAIGNDEFDVKSAHTNVKGILFDNDINVEKKDYTYPALSENVIEGEKIAYYSVKDVIEKEEVVIAHNKVVRKNRNLDLGTSRVVQEGKDGLKEIYISKEYVNGKLIQEEIVKEDILDEPLANIIEQGTKSVMVTSRGNTPYRQAITMEATAYDLSYESCGKYPDHPWYGLTASGTQAGPGVVAVDPRVIPLGTKLYVESLDGMPDYGFCVAEDTGGAIKGNRIDLFFESSTDVANFGRRNVKVYILD